MRTRTRVLDIDEFRAAVHHPSNSARTLVAALLATFHPVGERLGMNGIDRLARLGAEFVSSVCGARDTVGFINLVTVGVITDALDPTALEQLRAHALGFGGVAQIRYAVGTASLADPDQATKRAVAAAERDLARRFSQASGAASLPALHSFGR
jgi:hypothetical protein